MPYSRSHTSAYPCVNPMMKIRSAMRLRKHRVAVLLLSAAAHCGPTAVVAEQGLPLVYEDDFESSFTTEVWFPTDAKKWTVDEREDNRALHLLGKSDYQPPFRSPHSIILLKDRVIGDFVLTAKVMTLQKPTGHRDMDIFFGWQDPSRFYYVHLGEKPDPNSSQIFIVKDAPRKAITKKNSGGIPWEEGKWHEVKVVRKVTEGLIEVYFDDMETPAKTAYDKTFEWGLIGLGSFDDLGLWDDVKINGVEVGGMKPILPEPNRKEAKKESVALDKNWTVAVGEPQERFHVTEWETGSTSFGISLDNHGSAYVTTADRGEDGRYLMQASGEGR